MKKTLKMLLGLTLLLCLMSLSIMSGTLAKYTDTVYGKGPAVVAKFAYEFKSGDTAIVGTSTTEATTIDLFNTVSDSGVADDPTNLIAPGTNGTIPVTFKNLSDVSVEVVYGITLDDTAKTIPLVFSISGTGNYYSDYFAAGAKVNSRTADGTADGAQITITGNLAQMASDQHDAQLNLYTPQQTATNNPDLFWFWAFEGGTGSTQTDAVDTALGKASTTANRTTANVTITATITQLDN